MNQAVDMAKLVAANREAAFLILFVFVFIVMLLGAGYLIKWLLSQNDQRTKSIMEQSAVREEKLMDHNNRLIGALQDLKQGLNNIFSRLGNVEDEVKEIREKVG